MARLTAAARKALPASAFACPGRKFPIHDKPRARAALAYIRHAPAGCKANVRRRAKAMLGKGKSNSSDNRGLRRAKNGGR